jgi:hypothetical protein
MIARTRTSVLAIDQNPDDPVTIPRDEDHSASAPRPTEPPP